MQNIDHKIAELLTKLGLSPELTATLSAQIKLAVANRLLLAINEKLGEPAMQEIEAYLASDPDGQTEPSPAVQEHLEFIDRLTTEIFEVVAQDITAMAASIDPVAIANMIIEQGGAYDTGDSLDSAEQNPQEKTSQNQNDQDMSAQDQAVKAAEEAFSHTLPI